MESNETIPVDETWGGEVAEFIRKNKGKTIKCFGVCNKNHTMDKFVCYTHSDGLADKDGDKWWVYFKCPKCEYGHSFAKMDWFLSRNTGRW